ncbi:MULTISPECIES: C40 family peptidase [Exiguobacterium]|uniref:C40 family peptidase n=1 Tax=Exiguobacterium TaxID=33986 RepID=UPI001AEA4EA8|nr:MULTISPECIES: C40 family peptidase [Exiguobacterium]MCT4779818.1 C40 family peptidase [Exiguobacterium soli]
MSYTVYYYHRKRKRRYDVSKLIKDVSWTGSVEKMYRTAIVSVTSLSGVPYNTGEKIRIYKGDTLIFTGRVFKFQKMGTGDVALTCHDDAFYLFRSQISFSRASITLSEVFELCCKKVGIEPGYVKKTKKTYKNLEFVGETMQTILYTVMGMERERTGKRYYVRVSKGKLEFRERGALNGVVIEADVVQSIDAVRSAESTYTAIKYDVTIDSNTGSTTPDAPGSKSTATLMDSSKYHGPDYIVGKSGWGSRMKGTDKWNDLMIKVGREAGIDPLFLKVIMTIESEGDKKALGPWLSNGDRARGLFQIVPSKVDTDLDWARLLEAEYNMRKAADIFLYEKGNIAKSLGKKMSVAEMARFWVGYSETDYSYAYQQWAIGLYTGMGGDPDSLITESNNNYKETGTTKPVTVDSERTYTLDSDLRKKLGVIIAQKKGSFDSKKEFEDVRKALAKDLLREERIVTVKLPGTVFGVTGRKVVFKDSLVGAGGTWYIRSDDHRIDEFGHNMTLTLSNIDETPEPEYTPPKTPEDATGGGETGGGSDSGVATGKAADVVAEAQKWVGQLRYVFGGKSIVNGTGDCSGFTKYVFMKAIGLNIGDGTSNQLAKGKKISFADARAGDLVFFAGTYRAGVSHVGIVTEKGMMIDLQSGGCIKERYDGPYWKKYLLEVRRVL